MKSRITRLTVPRFAADLINVIDRKAVEAAAERSVVVSILGNTPGDGTTTVIRDLLRGGQGLGRRTLVLDLNLKRPSKWNDVCEDFTSLEEIAEVQDDKPIVCPPSGSLVVAAITTDPKLSVELQPKDLSSIFQRSRRNFELVFVDAPPFLQNSLTESIAVMADQTYFIARQERTTKGSLNFSVDRLRSLGREPSGIIYNDRRFLIPDALYRVVFGKG